MRRKWLVLSLAAVGLVVLLGGGYAGYEWLRYVYREDPNVSTAPEDSGFAPRWPSGTPSWHWPADFKLPLKIVLDDIPEVPERLVGPSPPIEEKSEPSPPIEQQKE